MRKIILPFIVMLSLLIACAESPESQTPSSSPAPAPEPAPAPAPVSTPAPTGSLPLSKPTPEADIPEISEEEMAASLWSKLPNKLPDGYTKSQFLSQTGNATYMNNGKWEFCLSGTGSKAKNLPQKCYEKTLDNWVLNRSKEVTSYKLVLTANYYEKTDTLDILDIQKLDEKTSVETISEKPTIGEGLKLEWIQGMTLPGYGLRVQGNVTNIGCAPLENVSIEVATFDLQGNWLRTDSATLSPSEINAGEDAGFLLEIRQELKGSETGEKGERVVGRYSYRFVLPSGEVIYLEED